MSHEDESAWKKIVSTLSTIQTYLHNLSRALISKITNFIQEPIKPFGLIFFIIICSYLYLKYSTDREQPSSALPERSCGQYTISDQVIKQYLPDQRNFLNRNFF